jgi:hypothetical protein
MGIFEFSSGFDDGPGQAERALRLSHALLSASPELLENSPILGVGLMVAPVGEMLRTLHVVVAVDSDREPAIAPAQTVFLTQLESAFGVVFDLFETAPNWLREVRAFGLAEPEFHLHPGDRVQASLGGSVGCSLSWTGGVGFALAGHVAPTVGSVVYQRGNPVGTVVWANNPTGHGVSVEADFSVAEFQPGTLFNSPYSAYGQGRPYDTVQLVRANGPPFRSARLMGMCVSMALPACNSTLGDTYMTLGQFSSGGDSGAPVIGPSGQLIGHVIGASPGITTFIQDLSFQIGAASAALGNLGVR